MRHAYRLLNHGPTTLVTSAHAGKRNVMAAAWVMPVDYDPPKVAAVLDGSTLTRELVDASGEFGLSVPGVGARESRTIHHLSKGTFLAIGERIDAKELPRNPA